MSATPVVPSLFCQCKLYFLMHVEEFSVSLLSLLPVSVREELLWLLPVADVCLLEGTEFVEDLDMEAYWTLSCGSTHIMEMLREDGESLYLLEEQWGRTEFAKACYYGQIVSTMILCSFNAQLLIGIGRNTLAQLYMVRKVHPLGSGSVRGSRLAYPSRYARFNTRSPTVKQLIRATVNCFGCKLPKILKVSSRRLRDSPSEALTDFLSGLRYLKCTHLHDSPSRGLDFVISVLRKATKMEVLTLEDKGLNSTSLPKQFFLELSSLSTFWSQFRLLKLLASHHIGYIVDKEGFDAMLSSYLTTPTDHAQRVVFSYTSVMASDLSPQLPLSGYPWLEGKDRTYLSFKTVEFDNCRLVCPATSNVVTCWLGRSITVKEDKPGVDDTWKGQLCSFNIKASRGQKRKFSELEGNGD